MEQTFFCQWFDGFEKGLEEIDPDSRSCLLKHCAKHCADTGVLQSYLKLHQTVNGEQDAFYARLHELGNVRGEVTVSSKEYFVCFPECACDLHTAFGIDTPHLCECSRQSILYVGKKIWGDRPFRVEEVETVLSGGKKCRFKVIFE